MSVSVTQLLYLRAAIDKGSLRGAATALGASQPTLSIRRLEEELNILLLIRTAAGVGPTEEAQAWAP